MCGITGIIEKNNNYCDKSLLQKLNNLVEHRGPDGEGYFIYKNLGFGHRRLSIIDLTDSASQPMQINDRYVITYNGEIYNYLEVKIELENLGVTFNTNSDTEVILRSYEIWGEKCVDRFNGMWAFALFDKENENIFISRDRFGVKPLYFLNNTKYFIFSSEIKQILSIINSPVINRQSLSDYFYLGYSNYNSNTFFKDIYQLDPGCNLTFNLNNITPVKNRYFNLKFNNSINNLNEDDSINLYKGLLNDSINLRLRSDVTVGSCLSGGLDSSYITSYANKLHLQKSTNKFKSITSKSIQSDNDESHYAKLVADNCNLDWNITMPKTEDFINILDKVIEIQEEPFGGPSIISQYFVFKKAKELNCIVMLDGQGGDETLLGYERYYASIFNSQSFFDKIISIFSNTRNSKLNLVELLKYLIYFNNSWIRKIYLQRKNKFIKNNIKILFNNKLLKLITKSFKNTYSLQLFELTTSQLRTLLNYEDKNSMANSIETRLPFLDYRLVEVAISIKTEYKIKDGWTKYPLRKFGSDDGIILSEIAWRKNKNGFEAPTKTWLGNKEANIQLFKDSDFLNNFIDFNKIKYWDDTTYWKILNVYMWQKKFNVSF
jgi:asparagine synthase (glutamine-hydrolysing)